MTTTVDRGTGIGPLGERSARWVVAVVLLVWLAAPYWPYLVDDALISAAYAEEWVSSGELRWTTGEVVEGYSNFLMVAWLALMALADLDLAKWAQLSSLGFGVSTLALLTALLPRGWGGTLTLLAVAAWAPLNYWSVQAMETTLYTLLLVSAWALTMVGGRVWPLALGVAALASLTRPEGLAHLLLIAATGLLKDNRNGTSALGAIGIVYLLIVYHAVRYSHYGSFWPTSVLVKISGVPLGTHGLAQLAGDAVPFLGVMVVALASLSFPRSPRLALAAVPMLVQSAVLVRASGDWMLWSRITMPGFLASLAAAAVLTGPARPTGRRLAFALGGAVLGCSLVSSGFASFALDQRIPLNPRAAYRSYTQGLDTPVAEDVVWAAWNVGSGDRLMAIDAGILGNMEELRFVDLRGLTHRPSAQATAERRMEPWFRDQVTSEPPAIEWIRLAEWDRPTPPPVPDYLFEQFELAGQVQYENGSTWWYSSTDRRGNAVLAARRLELLYKRYPSQPFLARHAAVALRAAGRVGDAIRLSEASRARWPREPIFAGAPENLTMLGSSAPLSWVEGRGFALYWNAKIWSVPLSREDVQSAVVYLDQDQAGDQPAQARLSLSGGCSWEREVSVSEPIGIKLQSIPCVDNGPSTITVQFLNDESRGDEDRNLYVRLELARY